MATVCATQLSGLALSCERQQSVNGNTLEKSAIMLGPHWWETVSSQWLHVISPVYQDRPSVETDNKQSVAVLYATWPSGRQQAVSGNTLYHLAVRTDPLSTTSAYCSWYMSENLLSPRKRSLHFYSHV